MTDNPRDKVRREFEGKLSGKLSKELLAQKKRLLEIVESSPINSIDNTFWANEDRVIADSIFLLMRDAVLDAVDAELWELAAFGIDIAKANETSIKWAREYTFELVKGINANTQKTIADSIAWYFSNPGTTVGELNELLSPTFGPARAEMIAVTEVTRAYSQGVEIADNELKQLGIETDEFWETNYDELVCDICGTLDGKKKGEEWDTPPPAHPRCRCWTRIQLKNHRKMAELKVNALLDMVWQQR